MRLRNIVSGMLLISIVRVHDRRVRKNFDPAGLRSPLLYKVGQPIGDG